MPKWTVRPYGLASGSGLPSGRERRRLVDGGVVGAGEVGGTAPQLGQHRAERLEHLAGRGAGGERPAGLEHRKRVLPAVGEAARDDPVEQGRPRGVRGPPPGEPPVPGGVVPRTPVESGAGVREDLLLDLEGLLRVEAQHALGGGDLVRAERRAVRRPGVPGVRRGPGDDRAQRDDRRAAGLGPRRPQGRVERGDVDVAVPGRLDALGVPAVGGVPPQHVLGERGGGVALDGDVVVVVDEDEVAELLVAGQRGGLGRDALLKVAVGDDAPDRVVEGGLAPRGVGVEQTALVARGHRHAHGVGDTLAERPGRRLDAGGVPVLGVSGRLRAVRAEALQVRQLQLVAGEEELGVEGQRGVSRGQHEAVAPGPLRIGRIVPHHLLKDRVGDRGQTHGRSGMPVAHLLHGVGRQQSGGVDRTPVGFGPGEVVRRLRAHLQEILDGSGSAALTCSNLKV
ncbi:hypothetical protein QFZ56_006553 [Streptomyces achromogenes]|uniref:Uncharacterized protein n=1 Tax=Streptomyces achromogenes TaxID=67255 RepID=A0ABU0QA92_STRAH|nr:hypothetical protein [Streptomyces achromogenes]